MFLFLKIFVLEFLEMLYKEVQEALIKTSASRLSM
jgi:hypothetical protein